MKASPKAYSHSDQIVREPQRTAAAGAAYVAAAAARARTVVLQECGGYRSQTDEVGELIPEGRKLAFRP